MELKEYVKNAHKNAKDKGFWDEQHPNIGEKLMLIVTELAEAMEALRGRNRPSYADIAEYRDNIEGKGIPFDRELFQVSCKDSLEDELADTLIRTFDLCGYLNIDIEFHINQKMRYNATREKLHGKKF